MKYINLKWTLIAMLFASVYSYAGEPECTKDPMWEFVVNNAQRTLDEYATDRNPNAVFVGPSVQTEFIKQYGGEFKGRYLLKVVNSFGKNTSFAMLLPLFDENVSSKGLNDEDNLWKIVVVKYNGKEF